MTHTWTALATQYQNKVPNSIFLQFANDVVLAWNLGIFILQDNICKTYKDRFSEI